MKKALAVGACALLIGLGSAPATAQVYDDNTVMGDKGADMVADILVVRPVSLIGTVLSSVAFFVTLPLTLPTQSADEAAEALLARPFAYTFARPLGEFTY